MGNRRPMSVDELELLVHSVHREYIQDPSRLSASEGSIFFKANPRAGERVHIFHAATCRALWPTLGDAEYSCERPGFFSFKAREKYDKVMELFKQMTGESKPTSVEENILRCIPAAKDIIAEKALVEDED